MTVNPLYLCVKSSLDTVIKCQVMGKIKLSDCLLKGNMSSSMLFLLSPFEIVLNIQKTMDTLIKPLNKIVAKFHHR